MNMATTKTAFFWDVALCSLVSENKRFGSPYCLQLHGMGVAAAYRITRVTNTTAYTVKRIT
jgi:hypothetical protein